jgi:hypothetical protein
MERALRNSDIMTEVPLRHVMIAVDPLESDHQAILGGAPADGLLAYQVRGDLQKGCLGRFTRRRSASERGDAPSG